MKIFLAAPFKGKIVNGSLPEDYKKFLIYIKKVIENLGIDVHLALEREKWGEEFWSDEDCTKTDYEEIKNSDIIIALIDKTFSGGTHVELGWASVLNKKIIILTKNKENLCSLVKGLSNISRCKILEFSDVDDLSLKLKNQIIKWQNSQ